jgi:hypothetical protein
VSREELETRSRRHGRARSTVTRGKDW